MDLYAELDFFSKVCAFWFDFFFIKVLVDCHFVYIFISVSMVARIVKVTELLK